MRSSWIVNAAVIATAASMVFFGVWARWDSVGFSEFANWPHHAHFLHDAGVFQIGIGVTMLAALVWRDVIAVVLAGFVVTNSFHAINHLLDLHRGGNAADPWLLLILSAVGLLGLGLRVGQTVQRGRRTDTEGEAAQ